MKPDIHPPMHSDALVICSSCGNKFTTASIKKEIHVEVCHKCHPYFTGEHRFIDTKGRVESFQSKQRLAETMKEKLVKKRLKTKKHEEDRKIKSLRELLSEI
ncbi:50S ribosomal protein L31 [Candidatus Roizmanbacteria bacterium]|nr:50S ribosomal protein L31 [Candidatus Roizmanbacteria bacterium]